MDPQTPVTDVIVRDGTTEDADALCAGIANVMELFG